MSKTVQTKKVSQDLSAGALTNSVTIGTDTPNKEADIELLAAMLVAESAISQVVTLKHIDSDTDFTFILDTESLSSATNYVFRPQGEPPVFKRGDKIELTCANSGTPSITVHSKLQYREVE